MIPGVTRKRIGVLPRPEFEKRPRLFGALESAFPIQLEAVESPEAKNVDALVVFAPDASVETPRSTGTPCLIVHCQGSDSPGVVRLAETKTIDSRLRGWRLAEETAGGCLGLEVSAGEEVLADAEGKPLWAAREYEGVRTYRAAIAPPEAGEDETLRDALREGRFIALLPWVHFLREITSETDWSWPALRAAFIFDDPNLHGKRYGYIKYHELAEHARENNYHAAMATVPMDAWLVRKNAAKLLRENEAQLSLLMHGNNHVKNELAREDSVEGARGMLAQALRRVESIEERGGVRVDKIITAPHGRCSQTVLEQAAICGLEGACVNRTYPWLPWRTVPTGSHPLAQWYPGDVVCGSSFMLVRHSMSSAIDDYVFRAYLNQPLLLAGHHDDLRGGMGILAEKAGLVNRLGDVRWSSVGEIARSNYATRLEGDTLLVRLFWRRVRLDVPEGVKRLVVEMAPIHGKPTDEYVEAARTNAPLLEQGNGTYFAELEGEFPSKLDLALSPRLSDGGAPIVPAKVKPYAFFRRLLTETRDRIYPMLGK